MSITVKQVRLVQKDKCCSLYEAKAILVKAELLKHAMAAKSTKELKIILMRLIELVL